MAGECAFQRRSKAPTCMQNVPCTPAKQRCGRWSMTSLGLDGRGCQIADMSPLCLSLDVISRQCRSTAMDKTTTCRLG